MNVYIHIYLFVEGTVRLTRSLIHYNRTKQGVLPTSQKPINTPPKKTPSILHQYDTTQKFE